MFEIEEPSLRRRNRGGVACHTSAVLLCLWEHSFYCILFEVVDQILRQGCVCSLFDLRDKDKDLHCAVDIEEEPLVARLNFEQTFAEIDPDTFEKEMVAQISATLKASEERFEFLLPQVGGDIKPNHKVQAAQQMFLLFCKFTSTCCEDV